MTVPVSDRLSQLYVGNGVNTRFDFSFRIFDQEDETGIAVRVKNGNEFEFMDEALYASTVNQDGMGGYITFTTPPNSSTFFYICGNTPVDQLLDITNYDNFYPDAIERALDKLTAVLQEWKHLIDFEAQSRSLADIDYDELAQKREIELQVFLLEEIRKQGVALDQLENYYEYLMDRLAQIATDNNWDASFIVDGDKNQHQINEESMQQTVRNYTDLPVGLFMGQPAKFNGIQYIWDAESTITSEDNLIIQVAGTSVGRWIIHAYDGCIYSNTVSNIQTAVDYCAKNKLKFVQSSDLTLNTDLYINTFESDPELDYFQYDMQGYNLHFTNGGLWFKTSRFTANGLRVSSDDAGAKGGIILRPFLRSDGETVGFPVRFTFLDSRVTNSKTNGWYVSNSWIGFWFGCYARHCEKWGVYLDHLDNNSATLPGSYYNISCNGLIWKGGEIQGNGKSDGTGGGVYLGRLISGVFDTCIESNLGDGVLFVGASNNVTITGYIELNGSLPTNVDIKSNAVASAADRPRNIFIERTNHTPRTGQERSIDCYDIINLVIDNPIFYGAVGALYTKEPIRVRESVSTYSSGKVINPTMLYNGYTQQPLLNECAKFGQLKKQIVLAGVDFPADVDTTKYTFITDTKETMARYSKLTFKFLTVPNTNLQPVRITLSARGYPLASQFSLNQATITPSAVGNVQILSHEVIAADKTLLNGGVGWAVSRLGTHADDTSTVPITCVGAEMEYYCGVVY